MRAKDRERLTKYQIPNAGQKPRMSNNRQEITGPFERIGWLEISRYWRYAQVELSGIGGLSGLFDEFRRPGFEKKSATANDADSADEGSEM